MNIEKALRNYLNRKGPKIKYDDFCVYCENNADAAINVLFKLANEEIDTMTDSKTLDRVVEVLKYVELIIGNCDDANRKIVNRKIVKLTEKLTRIQIEEYKRFSNMNKIKSEFNKVKRELEVLLDLCEKKDTKQYNFMQYLIEESKNIEYLEYTIKKMPALVNVKDKDEVPLFRNLVKSYLESIIDYNEENVLYYGNLITLIMSQKSFTLSDIEKRKCLEEVYKCINKMSFNKKKQKKNASKLELLKKLTDIIKGNSEKYLDIEEIASKYNIEINFSDTLLEKVHLNKTASEGYMSGRKEIDDYIISMDGDTAVEIDDALSCKKLPNGNYLLGVHIASVLGYFPYESEIVQNAITRNQSIYLPHRYQTKSDDFNNEANKIIAHGTKDEQLQNTINNLLEVTKILDKKYVSTELYDKIKENVSDTSELRVKRIGSENIVYQSMLLTGNRVAEYFNRNGFPLLYRVHYVNEENNRKLEAMIDNLNRTYKGNQFKNLYQLIEGIYPKGWYAEEGRHTGLDLDHYCHCTSVLRRAADIIVEHALEICYDKEPTKEELEQLKEEIATKVVEINAKQTPIEYFLKEYQKKHRM